MVHSVEHYAQKYSSEALAVLNNGVRRRFRLLTKADVLRDIDEVVKVKGKPKESRLMTLAGACMEASNLMHTAEGRLTAQAAAVVIRAIIASHKTEVLEERAAAEVCSCSSLWLGLLPHACLQVMKDDDAPVASKAAKAKKGKSSAVSADLPGKRKSAMKTRAEEAAQIDRVDDEPPDGPLVYWCLSGFNNPALFAALADVGVEVETVLSVESGDDEEDEDTDPSRSGSASEDPPKQVSVWRGKRQEIISLKAKATSLVACMLEL